MHLSFQTGNPAKPIYDGIDDRTVRIFISFACQDSLRHSLLVTIDDECFRSTEGSNDPSDPNKESPNPNGANVGGLESIPKGTAFRRDDDAVGGNLFSDQFGNPDILGVAATTGEENVVASDNASQVLPPFQPYTNVPPIGGGIYVGDDNDDGCGDEKSKSDGVYRPSGLSEKIEEFQIFKSKKDLNMTLSLISMCEKFNFKIFKSNTQFIIVRCLDMTCLRKVRAKRLADSGYWMVTKYVNKHTCPTDVKNVWHRRAKSWVIGEYVKKRLINPRRVFRPKDVMDDIRRKFGVDISYTVAWRGREYAYENLRLGTPEQSYRILPGYLHMLRETNPGTVVNLETGNENRFMYLFIAFDASIQGFNYCRPVVSIDATHMKGKYRGVLFTVVCHDANKQIFPLDFGIGDLENDTSWIWFLRRLKENFGERPAVKEVFPNVFHGLCIYHLLNNLKAKFKSKTKELEDHYSHTAKVYNVEEFNVLFYSLCFAIPRAKKYLEEVGIDRWTRSHSPSWRYNIMTTNISESMNVVLVKVRELPITTFVNDIRLLCEKWFYDRRNKAKNCTRKMSTDVEKKLERRRDQAQVIDIQYTDQYNFDVIDGDRNFCVDVALWTCGCRKFQLDQLPCEHALVVARRTAYEAYDLCSSYYSKDYGYDSYKGVVHPLPHIT
ncbi:hypothetical protein UlMin_018294 [Ulmus minor]